MSEKTKGTNRTRNYRTIFPPAVSAGSIIRIYVLSLLSSYGPMYGKEISDKIAEKINSIPIEGYVGWAPATGQVYETLFKLEKESFVEGEWEKSLERPEARTKRIWSITASGWEALINYKKEHTNIIKSAIMATMKVGGDIYGESFVRETTQAAVNGIFRNA